MGVHIAETIVESLVCALFHCHAIVGEHLAIAGERLLGVSVSAVLLMQFPAAHVKVAMILETELYSRLVLDALAKVSLAKTGICRHSYTCSHLVHIFISLGGLSGLVESLGGCKQNLRIAENRAGMTLSGNSAVPTDVVEILLRVISCGSSALPRA